MGANFRCRWRCHHNRGVSALGSARHAVVADRVEAGSYAIAVAMTGGDYAETVGASHLESLFDVMRQAGINIQ